MKNIITILLALCAVLFTSCTVPVPGGQMILGNGGPNGGPVGQAYNPYPSGVGGENVVIPSQVESYTVDKILDGNVEALLEGYPVGTPIERVHAVRKKVAEYAAETKIMDTDRLSVFATRELGAPVRAQARLVDVPTTRTVVSSVVVRPDEVPDNIRAQFEQR
jgi:hypothetical protein